MSMDIVEPATDARREGLLKGLRQLTILQLRRIQNYTSEMLVDNFNYRDGKWCPLAIGLGLDRLFKLGAATNEAVYSVMALMGYSVNNTRGIEGSYFTDNREYDLLRAVADVIEEKGGNEIWE